MFSIAPLFLDMFWEWGLDNKEEEEKKEEEKEGDEEEGEEEKQE